MKKYCHQCGQPNESINGVAPKFCSSCGFSLGKISVSSKNNQIPSAPPQKKNIQISTAFEEDDDQDYEGSGNYSEVKLDIILDTASSKGVNFKNVMEQRPSEEYTPRKGEKKISKRAFAKKWLEEGGSLREGHGEPIDID